MFTRNATAAYTRLGNLLFIAAIMVAGAIWAAGQCVEHPGGKTAVVLNNETSYDLSFFIDDIDRGAVLSGTRSSEIEINSGEHLFAARALLQGEGYWVMVLNEVPAGHVCTWTVTDPPGNDANGLMDRRKF